MNGAYTVSVIMPAYNSELYIARAIESVLSQSVSASEIIIVDDGSTDNTAEEVKKNSSVKYIYQEHAGAASARNNGIKASVCDWISFLDSDDIWRPNHLGDVMSLIKARALVWACGGMVRERSDGAWSCKQDEAWKDLLSDSQVFEDFFKAFGRYAPFNMNGMVIKKNIFEEVGLFDEALMVNEDRDLYLRIGIKYPKIGFVWPATVVCSERPGSASHVYKCNSLAILQKHAGLLSGQGDELSRRFLPAARTLAKEALYAGIEEGDKYSISMLVDRFKGLLGRSIFFAQASLISMGLARALLVMRKMF